MISTQVHLVLGTKDHSKMCSFVTQHNATELNVHVSTISHLQRRFREYVSTLNRPHKRHPRTSTSGFFTCGIVRDQPTGQLTKLRIISVCNKALFVGGKTHSDWLGLAPQWVILCRTMAVPLPSCEILKLGSNEFI